MEDHAALASSMLVPYAGDGDSDSLQLSNFTRSSSKSRFRLPVGWGIKEVIRADGSRSDKYYVEPGTGVKFRSMKDVERRINGEIVKPKRRSISLEYSMSPDSRKMIVSGGKSPDSRKMIVSGGKSPCSRKMIVSGGKMIKLDDEDLNECQLSTVRSNITTRNLPDGWVVEKVPRTSGVGSDKYYYEPGTGLKFRSLKEVERHLEAKELKLHYHNEETDEDQLAIVSSPTEETSPSYNLPEGWVVEEVPRKRGKYIDKYYYEPGTGQKFRSLIAVERYLSELNEEAADEEPIEEEPSENVTLSQVLADLKEYNMPLSKAFKLPGHLKNSGSCKKNISREKEQNTSFNTPPTKINWVLTSPGGDMWNPFIGEKLVPESVKQQWGKRFMLMMGNKDVD